MPNAIYVDGVKVGSGGVTLLNDIADVDITTQSNGQALIYNSTSQKWKNTSLTDYRKYNVASFSRNGNSNEYCKICELTPSSGSTSTINDIPMEISVLVEGTNCISKINILFKSGTATSISAIKSFTVTGEFLDFYIDSYSAGSNTKFRLLAKCPDTDTRIFVTDYSEISAVDISWSMTSHTSVASSYKTPTKLFALTSDIPSDFVPASTGGTFEGDVTIDEKDGTTSVVGQSKIVLGNSTLQTADENSKGVVRLYSRGSKYVDICAPDGSAINDNYELNVPDKNGTIATTSDVSAIDLTKGGTIKADSGNTIVAIEGATSNNYGQLQLKRGDYAARLTAANNLTNNRDITLPNVGGNVVVSSNYGVTYTATGSGSTLSNYETWKSLFNRIRADSFNGVIRRSQLMCSAFDGQGNTIFSCQRYQSANYSIWGSFRGNGTSMVWYTVAFSSSNSVNVYKHVLTSSGLTVTTLTDEPAATSSDGTVTPVTITII